MKLKVRTYEQIDKEEQLAGKELTYETLEFGTGTFRYRTAGKDRHGYKKYIYRYGVETVLGDIERSLWQKLIYRLIVQHNEMALFNHLKVWYSKTAYFLRNKAELEQYTLECFSNRIFDNPEWVDYIPFNQEYRPEILNNQTEVHNENH